MRARKKPNLRPRLEACDTLVIHEPEKYKGQIRKRFVNTDAPLHLEIGCGKGQFVCEMAQRNPDVNFIAMEREENVAVMAVEGALRLELSNVLFILGDAENLPCIFEPEEIARIYINFCDPWHKSHQFRRRLTYRGRLEVYRKLLAQGGDLWFKTDNQPLFRFSKFEFAAAMPAYFITEDLHNSEYAEGNVMTEYETRFTALGQPIYSIRAAK